MLIHGKFIFCKSIILPIIFIHNQLQMHILNKSMAHFTTFRSSYSTLPLRTRKYPQLGWQIVSNSQHKKNSDILVFFENMLNKYNIDHTPCIDEMHFEHERSVEKFVQTLNKIANFKGDKRLSYQHKLNNLLQICEESIDKIDVDDKISILISLSKNLQYNSLSKKLILDLAINLEHISLSHKFDLLFYTSSYQKVHSPIHLDTNDLQLHKSDLTHEQITPVMQKLLNSLEEQMGVSVFEIAEKNQVFLKNSNVVDLDEQQIQYVLKNLMGLQLGQSNLIHKVVKKMFLPFLEKISVKSIMKNIELFSQDDSILKYLSMEDWNSVIAHIEKQKKQIQSGVVDKYLENVLMTISKVQKVDKIRNYNKIMLYLIEKITQQQKSFNDSRVYSAKILQILLKITSKDKSMKMRAKIQNIFKQYLYYLTIEIKEKNYSAKSLIFLLQEINNHRKNKVFNFSDHEIKNIINLIAEQLWFKCDTIFNEPKKNQFFIKKLHFLINEEDQLAKILINSRGMPEEEYYDDLSNEYKQRQKSRKHYLIECTPEEIRRKVVRIKNELMEKEKELDE